MRSSGEPNSQRGKLSPVEIIGVFVLGTLGAFILLAIGFVIRTAFSNDVDSSAAQSAPDTAILESEIDRLRALLDGQLVLFGISVAILGIAATGLVAINVLGLIVANRSYERDRNAISTELKHNLDREKERVNQALHKERVRTEEELSKESRRIDSKIEILKLQNETIENQIDRRIAHAEAQVYALQAERFKALKQFQAAFGYYGLALDRATQASIDQWSMFLLLMEMANGIGPLDVESIVASSEATNVILQLSEKIRLLDSSMQTGAASFLDLADRILARRNASSQDAGDD